MPLSLVGDGEIVSPSVAGRVLNGRLELEVNGVAVTPQNFTGTLEYGNTNTRMHPVVIVGVFAYLEDRMNNCSDE